MPPSREKQAAGGPVIDPVRIKLIEAARADWITRLVDLSRRNNLLYFRPVPTSSIEVPTDSSALTDLLAGEAVAAQPSCAISKTGLAGFCRLLAKLKKIAKRRDFKRLCCKVWVAA